MYQNELWKIEPGYLGAYCEDPEVWKKIRRSYPQFRVIAEHYKHGKLIGLTYRVPARNKRAICRLLGVKVRDDTE